jgi:hypothetical protein
MNPQEASNKGTMIIKKNYLDSNISSNCTEAKVAKRIFICFQLPKVEEQVKKVEANLRIF